MRIVNRKLNQLNIWPGFVDILATLLIVTIFTIMISGIAQIYFNDVLGKKKTEITELDVKLTEIAEKLSLQISKNKGLNKTNNKLTELNNNLSSSLKEIKDENNKFIQKIKEKELIIKINKKKNIRPH